MKILDQFLSDYLGKSKGYPNQESFKGECLSIVKLYIKECFGIDPPPSGTNSAYGYWLNFPDPLGEKFGRITNTATLIPQKGWIAIWKPWSSNQYGHIAIVADGCTTSTLKNWAQNWTSRTFQLENNRYTNVIGFLKPNESIIDDMTDEQKRILEFLTGKTEGDVREAFGALQEIPNLNKKIKDLEISQKDLESRIEQLEADATANNKLIEDYQSQITTAKETESNLKADIQTWKNRYEAALKEQINKYTGWQLIKLGIQKLLVKK